MVSKSVKPAASKPSTPAFMKSQPRSMHVQPAKQKSFKAMREQVLAEFKAEASHLAKVAAERSAQSGQNRHNDLSRQGQSAVSNIPSFRSKIAEKQKTITEELQWLDDSTASVITYIRECLQDLATAHSSGNKALRAAHSESRSALQAQMGKVLGLNASR